VASVVKEVAPWAYLDLEWASANGHHLPVFLPIVAQQSPYTGCHRAPPSSILEVLSQGQDKENSFLLPLSLQLPASLHSTSG
jgi:hypothetical protein